MIDGIILFLKISHVLAIYILLFLGLGYLLTLHEPVHAALCFALAWAMIYLPYRKLIKHIEQQEKDIEND